MRLEFDKISARNLDLIIHLLLYQMQHKTPTGTIKANGQRPFAFHAPLNQKTKSFDLKARLSLSP